MAGTRSSGRKRIPTALRLLRGNPGHQPISKDEPQPELGATMPEGMSEAAQKHWPYAAKQLEDAGVLTRMDAIALSVYCETYASWRDAVDEVTKRPIVKRRGIPHRSAYFQVVKESQDRLLKLLIEFGMTPASRSRVSAVKNPATKKNRFALLRGGARAAAGGDSSGNEDGQ